MMHAVSMPELRCTGVSLLAKFDIQFEPPWDVQDLLLGPAVCPSGWLLWCAHSPLLRTLVNRSFTSFSRAWSAHLFL
jgi:hypothetical protein